MPSLEKRNGTYRLVVYGGRRKLTRSLKTRDHREAESLRLRADVNLQRIKQGVQFLPPGADLISFLLSDGRIASPTSISPAATTLGELCKRYEESLTEDSIEETTRHCIRMHTGHFKRIFGEKFRIHAITNEDLQRYIDKRRKARGRRGQPISRCTINKEIATLTTMWRWAQRRQIVDRPLPKDGLRFPKDDEKQPFQTIEEVRRKLAMGCLSEEEEACLWDSVFLSVAEILALLGDVREKALHPCLYPMIAAAAFTGARCSELRRSKIVDIDFSRGWLQLHERKRERGRRSLRGVPIVPELRDILSDWLKKHPGGPYTFCLAGVAKSSKATPAPRPLTSEEARHHLRQSLTGTPWEKLRGWHVFRHSFCSNCAAASTDQRTIDEWMGHQTDSMRKRYRHIFPNSQQAEIRRVFAQVKGQ